MSAAAKPALADGMPSSRAASGPDLSIFQVRRPDTLQFGSLEGLTRMAGVPHRRLRRLIAKEVVDNSLDEMDRCGRPGQARIERTGAHHYVVVDHGGGIPGDAQTLAELFSSSRAMLSGKFLRLPRRGLLGNGLRCLVAAVTLSGGTVVVSTRGRRTVLQPRRVGATDILETSAHSGTIGTRIEYTLGEVIPPDPDDLADATAAITLASTAGPTYGRRPSPHWLDANHLFETFATIEPQRPPCGS